MAEEQNQLPGFPAVEGIEEGVSAGVNEQV